MIPSEARIFHVDDSETARRKVAEAANRIGATVVASAASFEEARAGLAEIKALGINVVLTDENLSTVTPYEGRFVFDIVRAEHPGVHVLSVSGSARMSQDLGIPHISDKGTDSAALEAAIEAL